MKFSTFAQAILDVPALTSALDRAAVDSAELHARKDCMSTLQWKSNWRETGLRRYRVQLINSPRDDSHLTLHCNHVKRGQAQLNNVAYYWRDGMFVADSSHADEPAGYGTYKREHNRAAHSFEIGTGCKAVRNL